MIDPCFMLFALAFLAVAGYGCWKLVAAMARMMLGAPAPRSEPFASHCIGCGRSLDLIQHLCPGCRLQRNGPIAAQLRELFQVIRQLRNLQDRGLLDEALVDHVQDAFQARKQAWLATLKPAAKAAPALAQSPKPEPASVTVLTRSPTPPSAPVRAEPAVLVADVLDVQPIDEPVPEPVAKVIVPPPPPPPPRRRFTELLTAFMEERNILWGEVVGGLLIVGCSVALVISLWQTLRQIPYFPFLIIAAVTASLFGAGFYTLERWKLQSTSRGLLMIASLLVPLNLLVMAGLHRDLGGQFDWLEIGVLAIFLAAFTYLLKRAGQVLLPEQSWLYPTAVLGTSAFELAVPMLGSPPGVGSALLLGAAGALCHSGSAVRAIRHTAKQPDIDVGQAQRLFGFLGVSTFALATLLGLLIYAAQAAPALLHGIAPLVAVGGVPLLAGGALVHRRLAAAGTRTAGTIIALIGAAIQLAALPLAWPDPLQVGLVCMLNFVVLTDAALRWRLPIAHVGALPSLALGYLVGCHALVGGALPLSAWLWTAAAGTALLPVVALLGAASEWLYRRGREWDAISYAAAAGLLMLPSLALVTSHGQPIQTAVVYLLYSAGILTGNRRWRLPALDYAGLTLLPLGTLWLLHGLVPGRWDLWVAVIAGEALAMSLIGNRPARDVAAAAASLTWCVSLLIPIATGLSWTTATWAILAVTALLLAWSYRQAVVAYLGAFLILTVVLNGFAPAVSDWTQPATLLTACLGQATLTALIARGVQRWGAGAAINVLVRPLDRATMFATVLALPLLALPRPDQMIHFMVHGGWLALIWLAIALERRWAWLFAGFQAALCVTTFFGVTAWLIEQPWLANSYPAGLADPRSLHAYGIGLALLNLVWAVARPRLRRRAWMQDLMEPGWPAFDRVVLAELMLLQLGLALAAVLPGLAVERSLTHIIRWPLMEHAFGPSAWLLLGLLTVTLLIRARERITALPLAGLVLQGVTAATLLAGLATAPQAVAPVWAWALAGVFFLGSALVWAREPLGRWAAALDIPISGQPAAVTRWLLVGSCVGPLVVLSLLRLLAAVPLRPIDGTFFANMGSLPRQGVPALLLCITLVGHALRERSNGFAFAGGLAAQMSVLGGYALHLDRIGQPIDVTATVELLQLACIVAALWACAWLASRRWVHGDLMTWQCGLAVGGNVLLLLIGVAGLAGWRPGLSATAWTLATGSWWGWTALACTVLALAWRSRLQALSLTTPLAAVLGLAGIALLACTVTEVVNPEAGYRMLMLGSAFFALAWSLASLTAPPDREAVGCVALGYGLAVLLGLKAAFLHGDQLWAAGAIGVSAIVGALMAAWQRREGWAFAAGLGLNLAVSLVVWHEHVGMPVDRWLHFLLQANAIAGGLVALIWLAARERFMGTGLVAARPYLASQIALPCLFNLLLVGQAFLALFIVPDLPTPLANHLVSLAQLGGWLALLLPMAAALWYAAPERRLPLLVGHGLAIGVLAGCWVFPWDTRDWLGFHVMLGCWLLVAAAAASLSWRWIDWFEDWQIEQWATLAGGLVIVLVLRGSLGDPTGPWYLVAAILGVVLIAARVGVWANRRGDAYVTGWLILLAGQLIWRHYWPSLPEAWISIQALGLALTALLWLAIERVTKFDSGGIPIDRLTRPLALLLLAGLIGVGLGRGLMLLPGLHLNWLTWSALIALALAQGFAWRQHRQAHGLYATSLTALGLLLQQVGGQGDALAWSIGVALAGYVLAATWLAALSNRAWFVVSQMAVGALSVALGLWITTHFGGLAERLAGALSIALILIACVRLSDRAIVLRPVVFVLGGLLTIALGWSVLGQPPLLPWLHRDVVTLAALVVTASVMRTLPLPAEWHAVRQRMTLFLQAAALLMLPIVIAQEAMSYNRALDPRRTEMDGWAIVTTALGCLYFIVTAIRTALDEGGLARRWRTALVYLAEVVLLCLFIHMRLTAPWLFGKWLAPYWMFLVMAIAFAVAGLGELLRRRNLDILAGPLATTGLLMPLLPLLAFWVNEPAALLRPWAVQVLPGSEPLLHYLELTARDWDKYALLWFLTGALLAGMANVRQSFAYGLVAALAVNFGLWSLWRHAEVSFLIHPQFFLIPLALIVLAAEHIQRRRLSAAQALSLRYAALTLLYLASAADMYIAGLDQVGWPLFLMLLCVLGVLAGMLFEVKAYLFLGTGFLFLVIVSMIWHAAVDRQQPWVWYAAGIALGAAILTLFAVFEKRRNDVLGMLERIRAWS